MGSTKSRPLGLLLLPLNASFPLPSSILTHLASPGTEPGQPPRCSEEAGRGSDSAAQRAPEADSSSRLPPFLPARVLSVVRC